MYILNCMCVCAAVKKLITDTHKSVSSRDLMKGGNSAPDGSATIEEETDTTSMYEAMTRHSDENIYIYTIYINIHICVCVC